MKTNRLFLFMLCATMALQTAVAQSVNLKFSSDSYMQAGFRASMEQKLSALLTEINSAQRDNRSLNLQGLSIDDTAKERLNMIWTDLHFYCIDNVLVVRLLEDAQGYQVRDIPIDLVPMGSDFTGETARDLVISFNRTGQILSVTPAAEQKSYKSIMNNGREVTDLRRRREILKFVDEYFAYYEAKDIKAIENIFSENALIITGCVLKPQPGDNMVRAEAQVRYRKQNKAEYIENLRRSFARNRYIKIDIEDIKVERNGSNPNFYGVTLRQKYHSSTYSDDGYVFLLWDFTNEIEPKIHVRTWQPYQQTKPEDVFSQFDFMF